MENPNGSAPANRIVDEGADSIANPAPDGVCPESEALSVSKDATSHARDADGASIDDPDAPHPDGAETRFQQEIYETLEQYFDASFYRNENGDLEGVGDLLRHYIEYGWKEGRDPAPWFSSAAYLETNGDVRGAGVNPFFHYIRWGRDEGRAMLSAPELLPSSPALVPTPPSNSAEERGSDDAIIGAAAAQAACESAGIYSPALLKLFSVPYYRFLIDERLESEAAYLVHFATIGCRRLLPIAYGLEFDPSFYRAYSHAARNLTPFKAYVHWLSEGLPRNVPPNPVALMKHLHLPGYPDGFDADLYRENNPDIADRIKSDWLLLQHFVTTGGPEGRPGCPLGADTADIYVAVADHLSISGRDRDAQRIYRNVLRAAPTHPRALNHLGDSLLRQGNFSEAADAYDRHITKTGGSAFSYWNLLTCLINEERFDEALDVCDRAVQRFPSDSGLRRRRNDLLRRRFEKESSLGIAYAKAKRRDECYERMADAVSALARALEPSSRVRSGPTLPIRKVAIVGDHGLPQCKLYRITQKLEHFAAARIAAEAFEIGPEALAAFAGRMNEFSAVIFYRVPGWLEILELIGVARQLGLPTFYEIDDLIFDRNYFPDRFESYGGLITGEDYAGLLSGVAVFEAAMKACDYGIASTQQLARHLERRVRTGRVFLHRNALGRAHLHAMQSQRREGARDCVTVFYGSGTKAHKLDFGELPAPALARLFVKYGARLRLVLVGFQDIPLVLQPFSELIEKMEPLWDIEHYWAALAGADINLAVLLPSEATDSKSEIKWLEAGMLGIPSVVSRTANYEDTVEHGVTGYLVDTTEQWYEALDALIADESLREKVGKAAQSVICSRYGEKAMAGNLAQIFDAVWAPPERAKRKKILLVNVFYPPQAIGGATRVVHDNARDLMAKYSDSFDIEVFATVEGEHEPYKCRSYAQDGLRVTVVSTPSDPEINSRTSDPKMGGIFGRFLASSQPDLIHFHCIQRLTTSLTKMAKVFGIPYVVTVHDGWWISSRQFLTDDLGVVRLYHENDEDEETAERAEDLRRALSGARKILAVSEPFARIYRDAGFDNVIAIPNGVSKLPNVQRTRSPDGRVRLGYIGGLEAHKGYPIVQAAIRRGDYKNLQLLVVDHSLGVGDERYETWGTTPVTFIGRMPQSEVGRLYGQLDVLLAPSIWPESYGLVTREALSCGLWVVASNRGAVSEYVVDHENGFVIDVETTDGLAQALATIDNNPTEYLAAPKLKVSLRTSEEQADDLARIYMEVVGHG